MEVEYGVGITNRFSFLHEELEDQEVPVVPVKTIRPPEAAAKKGVKTDVKVKKEPKKEKEPPTTNRVARKESSQKVNIPKDEKRDFYQPREKVGDGSYGRSSGPRNNQYQQQPRRDNQRDGQPPRRNFKPRGGPPRDRENVEANENTENSEAVISGEEGRAGKGENELLEQDAKKDDAQNADISGDDQEKENKEDGEKTPEKTLTLKEWKALQAPREKPMFNIRRPGEGEDCTRLGKLVPKKKNDEDIVVPEEEYELDNTYYPQRAGKFKQVADVGFTTGYQKRRGGGRGRGRGFEGGDERGRRYDGEGFEGGEERGRGFEGGDERGRRHDGGEGRGRRYDGEGRGRGFGGGGDGRDASSEENLLSEKTRGRPRYNPRGGPRRGSPPVPRINDTMDFPSLG
ncbi:hypothetical protein Ocin01_08219 [Orchesella cincta]|uniref:Plasminogen activator inhibitor 1 RNA-binding protein n=1 Tax=Orchesella cincta TaxID=48709 RepID=A0A1D2N054_ORCCI|nr:hypothetical protein Ocin01_08219 [Orchesella cincta]